MFYNFINIIMIEIYDSLMTRTTHTHLKHAHAHHTHAHHTHRYDRLLMELEVKVTESVGVVAKMKKVVGSLKQRSKKNTTDVKKLKKNSEDIDARLKQSAKRQKRKSKQDVENPTAAASTAAAAAAFPRVPTPMVNSESRWFHIPESPCIARGVSPTTRPQYVSPMYASRNYMR